MKNHTVKDGMMVYMKHTMKYTVLIKEIQSQLLTKHIVMSMNVEVVVKN